MLKDIAKVFCFAMRTENRVEHTYSECIVTFSSRTKQTAHISSLNNTHKEKAFVRIYMVAAYHNGDIVVCPFF